MNDLTVLQAKRYGIISCSGGATMIEAAQRMVQEDISSLVVVDSQGYLAGIITRSDLLRASLVEPHWTSQTVERYMSQTVVTVTPQDRISHVARLLIEKGIHRVVIVQKEDHRLRPVGVISDADLVYHLTRDSL